MMDHCYSLAKTHMIPRADVFNFLQKSPVISGSFAGETLQCKAFYGVVTL